MNEGYSRYDVPKNRFVINEFSGFNATAARANGEMGEMQNLTCDEYPNLYQRAGRAEVALPDGMTNIQKIFRANGKLCYIADGKLWYDGKAVADIPAEGEKSVAVCNGKICVMPDKVFYDYVNEKAGYMDERLTIVNYKSSLSMFIKTYDKALFLTNGNSNVDALESVLKDLFSRGDKVRLVYSDDGTVKVRNNKEYEIAYVTDDTLGFTESIASGHVNYSTLCISKCENMRPDNILLGGIYITAQDNRIIISGFDDLDEKATLALLKEYLSFNENELLSIYIASDEKEYSVNVEGITYTSQQCIITLSTECTIDFGNANYVTFYRKIPNMDYICEKDNRLFGVCSFDNTVVSSKLGEPLNFSYFPGTSLDSYSVDVGSDGEFTGICSYAGDIVLFKERHIHVLSGTKPSLYQLSGIEAFGIEKGSNASLASLDGRLYYKSLRGIMAFEGTYPRCISQRLGNTRYSEAIGADDGRKYYVSMMNSDGKRELFVYDTETALWHREDSSDVVSMCEVGGALNIATKDSVFCTSGNSRERVPWSAVFGPFDSCSENKKLVSTLALRYKLSEGARFEIAVSFDGGEYEVLREVFYSAGTVLECDVRLKRCNEFSVRLSGEGYCRVLGMSMELREGSMK